MLRLIIALVVYWIVTPLQVSAANLSNPINAETWQSLIGLIIQAIFGITGSAALLMFVWGGFLWLTAAGEEKRIKAGTATMTWAVIGLAVIFGAYAFLNTFIGSVFGGT